jgi:hypothetical protein
MREEVMCNSSKWTVTARNPLSKDDPIFDNSFDAHVNGSEGAVFDTG